jgi:hypothetical protein
MTQFPLNGATLRKDQTGFEQIVAGSKGSPIGTHGTADRLDKNLSGLDNIGKGERG